MWSVQFVIESYKGLNDVVAGSDLIFLDLPMQPAIVINSLTAATELMEKRSRNYSDKPIVVMDELYVGIVPFSL